MRVVSLELKKGYSKESFADGVDRSLFQPQQVWEAFVEQASLAARLSGTFSWALIHQRNKREAMMFVPHALFKALRSLGAFARPPSPFMEMRVVLKVKDDRKYVRHRLCAFSFESFLRNVTPEHFIDLAGKASLIQK